MQAGDTTRGSVERSCSSGISVPVLVAAVALDPALQGRDALFTRILAAKTVERFAQRLGVCLVSRRALVQALRKSLPEPAKQVLRQLLAPVRTTNARIRSAVSLEPLSYLWGFDRGLPLHRYYLELFLEEFASDIRGHCLEFQAPSYAFRFGGSAIHKLDILHIDDSNPAVTMVADLTKPNDIPTDLFDCIVCTHVLHAILELDKVIAELRRILKPGGVLLATVPHVSMCDPGFHEIWRFTLEGLSLLMAKAFGTGNITLRAYGNSLTAAGEIRGLVAGEFSAAALEYHDPRFAVEVCARAYKAD